MAARLLLAVFLLDGSSIADALAPRFVKTAARQSPSPELAEALKQPQVLFDSMSSRMTDLQQGLITAKAESQAILTEKRELYEKKLKDQQGRNKAAAYLNEYKAQQIKDLTDKNKKLRDHADDLEKQCRTVKGDLEELRDNITLAREYLDTVLNGSQTALHDATEMNILSELEQEDSNASESQLRDARMEEIELAGRRNLAMLQLGGGARATEEPLPEDLMRSLLASWDGITNEQNASDATLSDSFEKEFAEGEEQYKLLLKNQSQLNATIAEKEALNEKLTASIDYLERTHNHLLEQRASLRQFARRLSNRPGPKLRLFQTPHSSAAAKPAPKKADKAVKQSHAPTGKGVKASQLQVSSLQPVKPLKSATGSSKAWKSWFSWH